MATYIIYSTNNAADTTTEVEAPTKRDALDAYCRSYGLVDYAAFLDWKEKAGSPAKLVVKSA